jgi:two-component system, NtrC family, sensor histidine kinase HydH
MKRSKPNDGILAGADPVVARAREKYEARRAQIYTSTDRLFAGLLILQWVFGIVLAVVISPYAWEGKARSIDMDVWAAFVLGGIITALPVTLSFLRPGTALTRHVVAAAQMLWSALLIHLTGGRIETHFHVFGSLALLTFYRDWKVLLTATVVVAVDHVVRGFFWPESMYGIVNPEWWRLLEHTFWLVLCASFLVLSCMRSIRDMQEAAEKSAELEALSEKGWRRGCILERRPEAANT